MKKILVVFAVISTFLMLSCRNTSATQESVENVPYETVQGYFVKNDANLSTLKNGKIITEAEFSAIFRPAAVMGANGMPTSVDFSKQYIISVVGNETDSAVTIVPVSLEKKGTHLTFTYEYKVGEKQSYTIRPALIIAVDSQYVEDLELKKLP